MQQQNLNRQGDRIQSDSPYDSASVVREKSSTGVVMRICMPTWKDDDEGSNRLYEACCLDDVFHFGEEENQHEGEMNFEDDEGLFVCSQQDYRLVDD